MSSKTMTWKRFKDQLEAQGVKDDDEIGCIDVSSTYLSYDSVLEVSFTTYVNSTRQFCVF